MFLIIKVLLNILSFVDFDRQYFWQWTDFESYIQSMCVFSLVTGFITWVLLENKVYIETLGFLAVFFEAMLGAPQFYRNFQNKSTKGMRWVERRQKLESFGGFSWGGGHFVCIVVYLCSDLKGMVFGIFCPF